MKLILSITLVLLISHSCTEETTGYFNRKKFISEYRTEFLNSELTLFEYYPRVKFIIHKDSTEIGFFIRRDKKLKVLNWTERKYLDTTDKFQCFVANYLDMLDQYRNEIKNERIHAINWLSKERNGSFVLLGDSDNIFHIPKNTFHFDPIEYFSELDSLISKFGIIEIDKDSNYIKLVFNPNNSLLYFPNIQTDDTLNMKLIKIDQKWYISNEKTIIH